MFKCDSVDKVGRHGIAALLPSAITDVKKLPNASAVSLGCSTVLWMT